VVTHHRLKSINGEVVVDPESKLEEPLVIRPTSETIIWGAYKGWIQSYRDLPLLINQWANVVRWELRTRLFLRTTEFLWQEGHTAHAHGSRGPWKKPGACSIVCGLRRERRRRPRHQGAQDARRTFSRARWIRCASRVLMQDGKALQMGTSHYLGQNFAKSSDVTFLSKEGKREYVYATSWGVSTRLVGALIMTHSDDKRPRVAAEARPDSRGRDSDLQDRCGESPRPRRSHQGCCRTQIPRTRRQNLNDRDGIMPGAKYYEWEAKGVPPPHRIGPKDLEKGSLLPRPPIVLEKEGETEQELRKRRKAFVPRTEAIASIKPTLIQLQRELFERAASSAPSGRGSSIPWKSLKTSSQRKLAALPGSTGPAITTRKMRWPSVSRPRSRCIPFLDQIPDEAKGEGKCILTGQASPQRVIMARAY